PQTATITISNRKTPGITFTAPTTPSSGSASTPPPNTISTDPKTGIKFFAGLADDAFFFDVPAELRYRNSLLSGMPGGDPNQFNRARDTFAGYNINAICYSIPVAMLKGTAGNVLGLHASTARPKKTVRTAGDSKAKGSFVQIDSLGIPAVNIVFVP